MLAQPKVVVNSKPLVVSQGLFSVIVSILIAGLLALVSFVATACKWLDGYTLRVSYLLAQPPSEGLSILQG